MNLHRTRNAKIVATLGPASSTAATVRALFPAGVDVFRRNNLPRIARLGDPRLRAAQPEILTSTVA